MKKISSLFFFLSFIVFSMSAYSYDLKHINDKRFMTNSCVISLSQDVLGRMWIGTCDGINLYDGHEITAFNIKGKENYISGNLTDNIYTTNNQIYLVQNRFALNLIDLKRNTIDHYTRYELTYAITQDCRGTFLFLCGLKGTNKLHYYHAATHTFKSTPIRWVHKDKVLSFFVDSSNTLWLVTVDKVYTYKIHVSKEGNVSLGRCHVGRFSKYPLVYCSYDRGYVHYVDNRYNLYSYSIDKKEHVFVRNMKDLSNRGFISSILLHHGDYFVGYSYNGVVILKKAKKKYLVQPLPINVGIFCMVKDRYQDVIWIGSDGQGVYIYSNGKYSIKSVSSQQLAIGAPVRCLYWDDERTLWVGTKGNGIIKIYNYSPDKEIDKCRIEHVTVENQPALGNNAVYDFVKSRRRLLWIATDRGISYYSYRDRRYHHLNVRVNGEEMCDVHKMYETANSDLWFVSTHHRFLNGRSGVFRAKITGNFVYPELTNICHYYVNHGESAFNSFFSIYARSDSQLFFANKTGGVYLFDIVHNRLKRVSNNHSETFSYVTAIDYDHRGHYLWGTNHGLVKYSSDRHYKVFNSPESMGNGTIHGFVYNAPDDIWFSTNMGLVHYDATRDLFHTFGYNDMMNVVEFSDGAAFKDAKTGAVFFGGINGFVCIQATGYKGVVYMPDLHVVQLKIFGENINPFIYISGIHPHHIIHLKHDQNFFNITFNAMDYIYGSNYIFYYRLKEGNDKWINNGQDNTVSFNNLAPGHYKLEVKYYNTAINRESKVYIFDIYIAHPWYTTIWAYLIYLTISFCIVYYFVENYIKRKRYREEKEMKDLQTLHEKEVSESKLNFFTTVAQEFSTPLTLISGPCQRILSTNGLNKGVLNYARLIQTNVVRLNDLIHELLEFRSVGTGNRKPKIQEVYISQVVRNIARSYMEVANSRQISYQSKIPESLNWNTDKAFFSTIIANLISNAFHYTDNGGDIRLELFTADNKLIFRVVNSGNNIDEAGMLKLLNNKAILNNFESHNASGLSRNRLGLALSYNMINLLNGSISVKGINNEGVDVSVAFPVIERCEKENMFDLSSDDASHHLYVKEHLVIPHYEMNDMHPTMLVIESEVDILWLIGDIFSSEFNIIPLQDSSKLDEVLGYDLPNLIICDMSMPGVSALEITRKLKSEKETQHIPILILSSKYEIEEQTKALSAGAEMYITKPFNVSMLQVSVLQIIKREESLRTYFTSSMSSFEKTNGHYLHRESKKFLQSVSKIIKEHLSDVDLSPAFIAKELNISTRNLYRKMDEIGKESPAEIIRECRLNFAQQLLLTSKDTISEIVFKSGFSNKVSFFKLFHERYGCTPKQYRKKNDMVS